MNSVLAQSRSLFVRADVLRSGQAPGYWKRELFRQTDRMARVLQSCAWIEELNQVHPLFLDQPLLGSCLEELTARGVEHSEVAGTQPSQLPRHFNHPPSVSRSNQRKLSERIARSPLPSNPDSPAPQRRARTITNAVSEASGMSEVSQRNGQIDKVSRLPPQAEGSLLRRFAGAAGDVSSDTGKSSTAASAFQVSRPISPAPVFKPLLPSRYWRDLVAYRAAKDLLRNWPAATLAVSFPPSSMKVQGFSRSVSTSPLLEEQWLTPVDGPAAPAEILIDLARLTEVTEAGAVSEMKWPKARSLTDNTSSSARSEHLGQAESARHRTGGRSDGTRQSLSPKHPEFLPAPDDRLVIQEVDRWREPAARRGNGSPATHGLEWTEFRDADGSSAELNLAPATLTPSLPPLLPPASPGSPALPMAAATSRYGAWRGEVDAPEKDLSLLAAQMKRILDEEARRHGIDV